LAPAQLSASSGFVGTAAEISASALRSLEPHTAVARVYEQEHNVPVTA